MLLTSFRNHFFLARSGLCNKIFVFVCIVNCLDELGMVNRNCILFVERLSPFVKLMIVCGSNVPYRILGNSLEPFVSLKVCKSGLSLRLKIFADER